MPAAIPDPVITPAEVEVMYARMQPKLQALMPDFEIRLKAAVAAEVMAWKRLRQAVILGHNYMEAALFHSVPDFVGDSLDLSRRAAAASEPVIVFCGVRFMAETAKILSPHKTVLLPTKKGGCSLAASITAKDVRELKARFPGVPVVTYVNTYADVKAETDICCTSSNAAAVVNSLKGQSVIFLPDEFLARNVARETGKHIIFPTKTPKVASDLDYQLIGWHGRCEVHEKFTVDDITRTRQQFPDVIVLSHPECPPDVVAASDFSGSTTAMSNYVKDHPGHRYLLLTECSMADNIIGDNPGTDVLRLCSIRCPHMGEITLEETRDALKHLQYVTEVPEDIRVRAFKAVERMLAISGSGKLKPTD